jgi:hypothetical protein
LIGDGGGDSGESDLSVWSIYREFEFVRMVLNWF